MVDLSIIPKIHLCQIRYQSSPPPPGRLILHSPVDRTDHAVNGNYYNLHILTVAYSVTPIMRTTVVINVLSVLIVRPDAFFDFKKDQE